MNIKIISFLIFVAAISSCKNIDKLTQFDIEYTEQFVIPPTFGIRIPFDIRTPKIKTNSASTFEVNDTRKDLIETINLTQLKLILSDPIDKNFSFLNNIYVYISAYGMDEKLIAWHENIPNDIENILNLETTDIDLKDYIKADSFELKVTTETDKIITDDYTIDLYALFFIDAKILGI